MKGLKYISAIVVASLSAACSAPEVAPSLADNNIAFGISTPQQSRTRVGITLDDVVGGGHSVYVYGTKNSGSLYENRALTREATTNKWYVGKATSDQWVSGAAYSFYGYIYKAASGTALLSVNSSGQSITVAQPTNYEESQMVDYLLSNIYTVADGGTRPLVHLRMEHAMSLVEIRAIKAEALESVVVKSVSLNNIYGRATMTCTNQANYTSGESNLWNIAYTGSNNYNYENANTFTVSGDGTSASGTGIDVLTEAEGGTKLMCIMAIPQQLGASVTVNIAYYVNERTSSGDPNHYVLHEDSFQLYRYTPYVWESGHHIIYTATIDTGIHLTGVIEAWKDVDYIEGTVLPEID